MDYVRRFFDIEGIIGQGAFGKVLVVKSLQSPISSPTHQTQQNQIRQHDDKQIKFALKCVHPILKPTRLANELRHLRDLGGQANVVQMYTAHFYLGYLFIVMDYVEHNKFSEIVTNLDYEEIVIYMQDLLKGLEHVHDKKIMHRDIKPQNFLFNRRDRTGILVDFGLAQVCRFKQSKAPPTNKRKPPPAPNGEYESMCKKIKLLSTTPQQKDKLKYRCDCRGQPKTCSNCSKRQHPVASRSGTPGYKAPEILFRYPFQTTAIDVWSAGVILACLLSGHTPFFRDVDDQTALAEIITLLGSHRVAQTANQLGIRITAEPKREPHDIVQLCKTIRSSPDKKQIEFPDSAYDLLTRMLDPNPLTRITAKEARKHQWLNDDMIV